MLGRSGNPASSANVLSRRMSADTDLSYHYSVAPGSHSIRCRNLIDDLGGGMMDDPATAQPITVYRTSGPPTSDASIQVATLARLAEAELARAIALAAGQSADEAHAAATKAWNTWAEAMLAERKALEDNREWTGNWDRWSGTFEAKTTASKSWHERARSIFSRSEDNRVFDNLNCSDWKFPDDVSFWGAKLTGGSMERYSVSLRFFKLLIFMPAQSLRGRSLTAICDAS
jgi:hypothetical protein